jgi:hypothetical protein
MRKGDLKQKGVEGGVEKNTKAWQIFPSFTS